jgi:hypothetical protein
MARLEEIKPVFVDTFIPRLLEEGLLYISLNYKTAVHLCACGCGQEVVTPLDPDYGWMLRRNEDQVSLVPSIGNYQVPCRTHYFITNNKIVWCP